MDNDGISTMEKSGTITLTKTELDFFERERLVPDRLATEWGLTYNELRDLIDRNQFVLV